MTNIEKLESLRTELIEGLTPVHQIFQGIIDELQRTNSEEDEKRLIWLSKELSGYKLDEEPDAFLPEIICRASLEPHTFGKGGTGYRVQCGVINAETVFVFDNRMAVSEIEGKVLALSPAPQVVHVGPSETWTSDAKDFVFTLIKIRVVVLDLLDAILREMGKDLSSSVCPDFQYFMNRDLIEKEMPPSNLPEPQQYDWDLPAIEKSIDIYSSIGLFAGQRTEDIIQDFQDYIEEYSYGEVGMAPEYQVIEVLSFSKNGVWCGDPERNVCNGNLVYAHLLKEWADISFGIFQPEMIDEDWEGEKGPIRVSFELNKEEKVIRPKYLNDWVDLRILGQINELISKSGRQFEYVGFGNWAIVVCLKPYEKELLIKELNFPFDKY